MSSRPPLMALMHGGLIREGHGQMSIKNAQHSNYAKN